ncbi:FkbM family methyltransferase [Azospirillum sp. Marseille-Q6669]
MPLNMANLSAEQFLAVLNSPFAGLSYAQEGEDRVLQRLLEPRTTGFYVDVGAHHPYRFSTTCIFYLNGWSGINIDATPGSMEAFRKHRPRDVNLETLVGCGTEPTNFDLYDEPALNTASCKRAAIVSGHSQTIGQVMLAPQRLDHILDTHLPSGTAIDFLTVDAEGMDLDVLRSNDFSRYRPHFIVCEDHSLDLESLNDNPLHLHMKDWSYRLVAKLRASAIWVDTTR